MASSESRLKDERKVLFVINDARFFVTHRLALAKGIRQAGYVVHIAAPAASDDAASRVIREAGFPLHNVSIDRQGLNPVRDFVAFAVLLTLYYRISPSIVHHVTVKPILYGSLAARIVGTPAVVNAVAGLGRLFFPYSPTSRARAFLMRTLYRAVLRQPNTITIFQNGEDRSSFIHSRVVDEESSFLIEGSGTELERFSPSLRPDEPPIVLFPGRILRQKGVTEFFRAARQLKAEGSNARFAVVGDTAGNRDALRDEELQAVQREGIVELWGWSNDMPGVMSRAAIICLPSYHEGLPKALIDACAAGRPIVATDIPGCRAAVADGVNGFLVPPRDVESLTSALRILLSDSSLRTRMGQRSREIAEDKFAIASVIASTLAVYEVFF
jgi:glycosyltransferase involved in cell wall biosynthesis